jgi:hypothetical protein
VRRSDPASPEYYEAGGRPVPYGKIPTGSAYWLKPRHATWAALDEAAVRLAATGGHYRRLLRDGYVAVPAFAATLYQPRPMTLAEALATGYRCLRFDKVHVRGLRKILAGRPRPVPMFP